MDYIQEYVDECAAVNFLVDNEQETSRFFHGAYMKMHEDTGQGWSEILSINNGLYVSMVDYSLNHRMEISEENTHRPFQLSIMLSGHFEAQIPGRLKEVISAGDVWCTQGPFEQAEYTHHPHENICGISIWLPEDLIESWLGVSCCEGSKRLEQLVVGRRQARCLTRGLGNASNVMRIARHLLYASRRTLSDKLHFESLALDFLSHVLTLNSPSEGAGITRTRQIRAAVDEAVDILHREWKNPPSIATLARWVGTNECYLKKGFREQIGMTIGAYIRQLRMTKALEMIETGRYSILETALFVGYSNPGHFSAAFKKFYGHLPSWYLPRSVKTI